MHLEGTKVIHRCVKCASEEVDTVYRDTCARCGDVRERTGFQRTEIDVSITLGAAADRFTLDGKRLQPGQGFRLELCGPCADWLADGLGFDRRKTERKPSGESGESPPAPY